MEYKVIGYQVAYDDGDRFEYFVSKEDAEKFFSLIPERYRARAGIYDIRAAQEVPDKPFVEVYRVTLMKPKVWAERDYPAHLIARHKDLNYVLGVLEYPELFAMHNHEFDRYAALTEVEVEEDANYISIFGVDRDAVASKTEEVFAQLYN